MIAPTAIIRGAGMSFGIPVIDVEGTTGYYNSNLNNKMTKALEILNRRISRSMIMGLFILKQWMMQVMIRIWISRYNN